MPFKSFFVQWNSVRTSLWFVPTICVLVAVVLSIITPEVDHYLEGEDRTPPTWIFAGSSEGARAILSTVAGSLITIIGVLFSITIVILQQASNQFTPRVMGNFMRQTGTQLTLGVYLATFLYSLLVLRYVRGENSLGSEFIPIVSVTMSMVLAMVCLGFLVYFVHHMATSLQASMVIANVYQEFRQDIDLLYPEHLGPPAHDEDQPLEMFRETFMTPPVITITSELSGYLQSVDDDSIVSCVPDSTAIVVLPQIGEFVTQGTPVIEITGAVDLDSDDERQIRRCLILGSERSRFQDPLFSVRQLVDIALKALSPGINDPTTANNATAMLGAALANLANRTFPERIRVLEHDRGNVDRKVHAWVNRPTFAYYVSTAFSEIRRHAASNVEVTAHLLNTLGSVGAVVKTSQRAEPIHRQIDEILTVLDYADFSKQDQQYLRERADEVRRRIPARVMV